MDLILHKIIDNFGHRFNNENDLSDIIWILCNTFPDFQRYFLKFFFSHLGYDCGEVTLVREAPKEQSRVDFKFKYKGKLYLIENKIYNREHHFGQYIHSYNIQPSQLGYIANYEIGLNDIDTGDYKLNKNEFEIRTWENFYFYIKDNIFEFNEDSTIMIKIFLEYLKKICSIFDNELPMKTSDMYSVWIFYKSIDEILKLKKENCKIINISDHSWWNPKVGRIGKVFEISWNKTIIKGEFGIFFNYQNPEIYILIKNSSLSELETPDSYIPKGKLFNFNNEIYDRSYWFEFTGTSQLNSLPYKEQIQLLREFVEEVANAIIVFKTNKLHK